MVLAAMASTIMAKLTFTKLPYDPQKDLAPVSLVSTFQLVLAVTPSLPIATMAQFATWAKANPDKASFGVPAQKITVIAPGIDDLPRSPGSPGPTTQILSVGQLIPRKGHDTLLRALAKLFDLDWHLTIAGPPTDPVHAAGLQALAENLNISRHVTFAGQATGAVLESLWHQADLFALTPHYEGYGMVFAEALRRGLPVVATHVGAVPTLLVPDAGTVTAPGDTDQLAKALRRLIFDRALRRDMAEAAWQSARDLPSWAEQAAKLAAVLAAHK